MFQEKNHLNDKITKIKLSLTEIKKKYENELLRKDMKISQQKLNYERKILELTDKTKEYEKMIEKLKTTISSHRNEKLNYEEIIFKQEETITELNDELNHNTDILKKKNEQMKQNEIYSLELIRIVNELKQRINLLSRNNSSNPEHRDLSKKIHLLNNQLGENLKKVQTLEQKNKILQGNYLKLSTALNKEFKRPSVNLYKIKQSKGVHKKQYISWYIPTSNNMDTMSSDINNVVSQKKFLINSKSERNEDIIDDNYLISESALPKVFKTNRSEKDMLSGFNFMRYAFNDNNNITEINQMMSELLDECK